MCHVCMERQAHLANDRATYVFHGNHFYFYYLLILISLVHMGATGCRNAPTGANSGSNYVHFYLLLFFNINFTFPLRGAADVPIDVHYVHAIIFLFLMIIFFVRTHELFSARDPPPPLRTPRI